MICRGGSRISGGVDFSIISYSFSSPFFNSYSSSMAKIYLGRGGGCGVPPSPHAGSATRKKGGQQSVELLHMLVVLIPCSCYRVVCVRISPRFSHLQATILAKDSYYGGSAAGWYLIFTSFCDGHPCHVALLVPTLRRLSQSYSRRFLRNT